MRLVYYHNQASRKKSCVSTTRRGERCMYYVLCSECLVGGNRKAKAGSRVNQPTSLAIAIALF
jgi:hypothetical protein